MLKTIDEIRTQISPNLQNLLNDILLESNDPRPLFFGDEQQFKCLKGKTFPEGINACFNPFNNQFIIFLKQIDEIRQEEQHDIAHELGHLWLLLLGLPPEKKSMNTVRQLRWETFFSPIRESMEHAVYYPLMKDNYQIDLYKIGNKRLANFITDQLPKLRNESTPEKLFLLLNYIKYLAESDNHCWLERLRETYYQKAEDIIIIGDSLIPLVKKLACIKNAKFFISQYRKVLEILDTHFGIPEDIWPYFVVREK